MEERLRREIVNTLTSHAEAFHIEASALATDIDPILSVAPAEAFPSNHLLNQRIPFQAAELCPQQKRTRGSHLP